MEFYGCLDGHSKGLTLYFLKHEEQASVSLRGRRAFFEVEEGLCGLSRGCRGEGGGDLPSPLRSEPGIPRLSISTATGDQASLTNVATPLYPFFV
jgi:hypothetical protein